MSEWLNFLRKGGFVLPSEMKPGVGEAFQNEAKIEMSNRAKLLADFIENEKVGACEIESSYEIGHDLIVVQLSCGHSHSVPCEELPIHYCSECGAKVVDE